MEANGGQTAILDRRRGSGKERGKYYEAGNGENRSDRRRKYPLCRATSLHRPISGVSSALKTDKRRQKRNSGGTAEVISSRFVCFGVFFMMKMEIKGVL